MRADTHHGPEQCSTSETEYIDAALTIVALEIPLATHGRAIHGAMTLEPTTCSNRKDCDCLRFRITPHGWQSSDVESVSGYPLDSGRFDQGRLDTMSHTPRLAKLDQVAVQSIKSAPAIWA